MAHISERMVEVDKKIEECAKKVEEDKGASDVLKAVINDFDSKSKKSLGALKENDERIIRDHVVEIEQAADSAKVAAEADKGISDETRKSVLDAHTAICLIKANGHGEE